MSKFKAQIGNLKLKSEVKYRAYYFGLSIIGFLQELPDRKIYWSLFDQLLRASTSIGANIIEGKSSSSKKEFIKYYEIALKSTNETKYWLCLLRDTKLVPDNRVNPLIKEAIEIGNMLGSSLLTL